MEFYCYLLYTNDTSKTYVGATTDPDRRLRQHNKEISGGAKVTGISVQQGLTWQRACYITGIPEWRSALQIEWRWKQLSRKMSSKMFPLERRMQALKELLALEKSTALAVPFIEWPSPPEVHLETEEAQKYY